MTRSQGRALHILATDSKERIAPRTLIALSKRRLIRRMNLPSGGYALTKAGRIALDLFSRIGAT